MKIKISRAQLLGMAAKCAPAVAQNPVLPVLDNLKMVAEKGQLTLAATDLHTTIIADTKDVQIAEEGAVCIPAKMLSDTLKALPEQPITIEAGEKSLITLTSSNGKYKMVGEDISQYPSLPETPESALFMCGPDDIAAICAATLYATSSDELRPAMTGVLVSGDGGKVTTVATDAHKLARADFGVMDVQMFGNVIFPKAFLRSVLNVGKFDGFASFFADKSNAAVSMAGTTIFGRLIDARYPNWEAVVPTESPNVLAIGRTELANSLRRVALFSNKTTRQVVLDCQEGRLLLHTIDTDFANEATEEIPCDYTGEPMQIGFNAAYLKECLDSFTSEKILLEMSRPSRAVIIRSPEVEGTFALVMPVTLQG